MKKLLLLLVISLCTLVFVNADVSISEVSDGYIIDYTMPALEHKTVDEAGNTYVKITGADMGAYGEIGKAELPCSRFGLVVADANEAPGIEVLDVTYESVALDYDVYPIQDVAPAAFAYDGAYYKSSGYAKDLAVVSAPQIMRDIAGVTVTINAVAYDPANATLTLAKNVRVKVKTQTTYRSSSVSSKAYDSLAKKLYLNYNNATRSYAPENYMIIVSSTFENNADFQKFVNHKKSMGFYNVQIYTQAEAGSTASALKSFIKDKYNNPATKPVYLLLVGDNDDYPHENVSGMKSYVYYTTMDGASDKTPDMFLGLFFARSAGNMANMVRKHIYTETHLDEMTNKIIHYSSFADDSHINDEFAEIQGYWEQNNDFEIVNVLAYKDNKTDQDMVIELNKGARILTYQGHGFQTGWQYFNALSQVNNSIYPFVLSFACLTGDFAYSYDCWAEKLVGHDKFATTFIGASENSSIEQKAMNRGMARGCVEQDIKQMGPLFQYGKTYVYTDIGSSYGWDGERKYHLFGDPSIYFLSYGPPPTPPATPTPTATVEPTPVYVNVALNRPVVVSGEFSSDFPKAALVDGNDNTAWGSLFNQGSQWAFVDLGQPVEIDHTVIKFFNPYYSPYYHIGISNDAKTWEFAVTETNGNGGVDIHDINKTARYIGFLLTKGAKKVYGIKEFEVYKKVMPTTPTPPIMTPTPTPTVGPTLPPIPEWQSDVSYQVGEKVLYNGKVYVCIVAHTSNMGWPPGAPGVYLWEEE